MNVPGCLQPGASSRLVTTHLPKETATPNTTPVERTAMNPLDPKISHPLKEIEAVSTGAGCVSHLLPKEVMP